MFRSPEGAKRQQQQLCGPATALTFNFVVAVGIIFMNKLVRMLNFQHVESVCNFPDWIL